MITLDFLSDLYSKLGYCHRAVLDSGVQDMLAHDIASGKIPASYVEALRDGLDKALMRSGKIQSS